MLKAEFSARDAADEGGPLLGVEDQDGTLPVLLAVADGDARARQRGDLDTVAAVGARVAAPTPGDCGQFILQIHTSPAFLELGQMPERAGTPGALSGRVVRGRALRERCRR
jgi:hypothetical protein